MDRLLVDEGRCRKVSGLLRVIADLLDGDTSWSSVDKVPVETQSVPRDISTSTLREIIDAERQPKHVSKKHKMDQKASVKYNMALPFLFEIPSKKWKDVPRSLQKQMMSEGPFFHARLDYMSSIVSIYQPLDEVTVCTVAKSLHIPHGHFTANAPDFKFPEECIIPVHSVFPKQDSFPPNSADFQFIETRIIEEIGIPWQDLSSLLLPQKEGMVSDRSTHMPRQHLWQDAGFGGGRAFSRDKANHRLSRPSMLDGTMDPIMVKVLCTMTKMIKQNCPHVWHGRSTQRLERYAKRIDKENVIEYIWIAATDVNSAEVGQCGFHDDDLNDPNFPEVVILSKVVPCGVRSLRISVIAATRKSILDAERRENEDIGPSLRFLLHRYASIDDARKNTGPLTFATTTKSDGAWCGIGYSLYPCHLEASIYVSPIIHYSLRMIKQFHLDFVEVICIFRSFALCSFTTFFATAALIEVLQRPVLKQTGLEFGYNLLERVHEIYGSYKNSKKPIPGTRFTTSSETNLPSFEQFKEQIQHMVFVCIQSFGYDDAPTNKKTRANLYNMTMKGLKGSLPSCGVVGTNHLINAMSIVGCVPLWYSFEIQGTHESCGFQFLSREYGLRKGEQGTKQLLDSFTKAVEDVSGKFCSRRNAESIVCNIFQAQHKEAQRFTDLVWADQIVYEPTKSGVVLWKKNGMSVYTVGPLVVRWPYDATFKLGHEIYMKHEAVISKGIKHARIDEKFEHSTRTNYLSDSIQEALN